MARITFGPTVSAVKGSIGGTTFQTNASGAFARARPYVKKRSTTKQQLSHQSHQHLLYLYSQLSSDNKDAWNDFAAAHEKTNKFGQSKILTGANWFLSSNYMRILCGETILMAPPDYNLPSDAPSFSIDPTAADLSLTLDSEFDWTDMAVIVWTSLPTNRQKQSLNQIRKYVTIFTSDPGTPVIITSEWEAAAQIAWTPVETFPMANIWICLETICISSGITSPYLCQKINTAGLTELDPDYLLYIAEFDTPPTDDRATLLNNLFIDLKSNGYFDLLDRMWLFCSEERQQCTISLKNPSSTPMEEINTGSITFVASRGLTGDGATAYCNLHYTPSSDGVNYVQDNAMYFQYLGTNVEENSIDMGANSSGSVGAYCNTRWSDGNLYASINANPSGAMIVSSANSQGLTTVRRTASNAQSVNRNGSTIVSNSTGSNGVPNIPMYCLAFNNTGVDRYSTRQMRFLGYGSSDINDSGFYTLMQAYMTAIGANV